MTGVTNNKLKTADLLVSLILLKKTTTSEVILKIGSRISSVTSVLTVLESTPFLKFQKTSGVNLERLLEFSKWVRTSMVTQLTLAHIKSMSLVSSTTQCTILSKMSLEARNPCKTLKVDTSKKSLTSRTLIPSVFSLTTTTTLDS